MFHIVFTAATNNNFKSGLIDSDMDTNCTQKTRKVQRLKRKLNSSKTMYLHKRVILKDSVATNIYHNRQVTLHQALHHQYRSHQVLRHQCFHR